MLSAIYMTCGGSGGSGGGGDGGGDDDDTALDMAPGHKVVPGCGAKL